MNRRSSLLWLIIVVTVAATSAAGQERRYRTPRTETGHPDLQGVWNFSSGVPLQRPVDLADRKVLTKEEYDRRRVTMRNTFQMVRKFIPVEDVGIDWMDNTPSVDDLRTSLITYPENGRLPALAPGVQRMPQVEDLFALLSGDLTKGPPPALLSFLANFGAGKKDSYTDFMMSERCLFAADVPLLPNLDGNYIQIIQGHDHVALISDFTQRVVAIGRTPPTGDSPRSWSGMSTGRWEGETLVVDTRNFTDRFPSFSGAGKGRDKVVTERFTRTADGRLEYVATVVDPKTFKDRVELSFPMTLTDTRIHEGACHEGNYSMRNSLSAARKAEEPATK